MCTYIMWCKPASKKWIWMLTLLQSRSRPKFCANKVCLCHFYYNCFVLVPVELFDCSGLHSTFCVLLIWPACLSSWQPLLYCIYILTQQINAFQHTEVNERRSFQSFLILFDTLRKQIRSMDITAHCKLGIHHRNYITRHLTAKIKLYIYNLTRQINGSYINDTGNPVQWWIRWEDNHKWWQNRKFRGNGSVYLVQKWSIHVNCVSLANTLKNKTFYCHCSVAVHTLR
jgi:hypothetical protein